jgi:hypothetical protein
MALLEQVEVQVLLEQAVQVELMVHQEVQVQVEVVVVQVLLAQVVLMEQMVLMQEDGYLTLELLLLEIQHQINLQQIVQLDHLIFL